MLDNLYTKLTAKVNYKLLMLLPIILSLLLLGVISFKGIPMSIDFVGGTRIELSLNESLSQEKLYNLKDVLHSMDLKNLKIHVSEDILANVYKLEITTTSIINESDIKPLLERHLAKELQSLDVIKIYLPENTSLSSDFLETLKKVTVADIKLDKERNLVTIKGIDLEEEKIKRIFEYRLGFTPRIDVNKKNFRMQTIGPSLGEKFREQGFWALIFAYILIVVVVFLIFRDFVPSIAIILAATCDAIAAFGGMSLFDIVLEPASLVSILMLIGYSVDTDILLTTRVLRGERGTINERIDNAMKTGLTMTTTTIVVMVTVIVLTNFLGVPVLSSIATVLLIGLLMDILTTWLMNAGLLKMYLEEMKGKPKSGVKK